MPHVPFPTITNNQRLRTWYRRLQKLEAQIVFHDISDPDYLRYQKALETYQTILTNEVRRWERSLKDHGE